MAIADLTNLANSSYSESFESLDPIEKDNEEFRTPLSSSLEDSEIKATTAATSILENENTTNETLLKSKLEDGDYNP